MTNSQFTPEKFVTRPPVQKTPHTFSYLAKKKQNSQVYLLILPTNKKNIIPNYCWLFLDNFCPNENKMNEIRLEGVKKESLKVRKNHKWMKKNWILGDFSWILVEIYLEWKIFWINNQFCSLISWFLLIILVLIAKLLLSFVIWNF